MLPHQEKAQICGYRLPQYFWFVISGAICDIAQALLDYCISVLYTLEWEKATVCWTVSYTLSIAIRHTSHRFIVFGEYEGTYWSSLSRTYAAYSASIVLSIVANHMFINMLMLSHRQAWLITMLWTGLLNYFLVKNAWRPKGTAAGSQDTSEDSRLTV